VIDSSLFEPRGEDMGGRSHSIVLEFPLAGLEYSLKYPSASGTR